MLKETAPNSVGEKAEPRSAQPRRKAIANTRVSPGGYFAVAALLTFISLVLLRTHKDLEALALIVLTWALTPLLVFTDRLYFDGQTLFRSGLLPFLSRLIFERRPELIVKDIERVDVQTLRTIRRGGSVRYRYRIQIGGKGLSFIFTSGGRKFRGMMESLLPRIAPEKLDARACELRDYLCDPRQLNLDVERLNVANVSLLEQTDEAALNRLEKRAAAGPVLHDEPERAQLLREVANRLRIAGRLRESAEAFRRALHMSSRDASLIYEFGRLLRSQAAAFGDARLLSRALAALRLAQQRGAENARLLERIGESFFESGQPARAAKAFRRALEIDERSYRAQIGLAELALGEGKLAHVIHHYRESARMAPDQATIAISRREADYYALLNDDDDYLSAELRRMNWLEGAGRVQRLAARVSFAALFVALAGSFFDQVVTGVGWALASSAIIGWSGALIVRKLLAPRRRVRQTES